MGLPSDPTAFEISYTERIIAHQMKSEASVKYIPGQILTISAEYIGNLMKPIYES